VDAHTPFAREKNGFFKFKSMSSEIINTAADPDKQGGSVLRAEDIGDVALRTYVGNQEKGFILRNVYYVPNIRKNLMSVSQIDKRGKELRVKDGKITIMDVKKKEVVCEAYRNKDLYIVRSSVENHPGMWSPMF